MSLRKLHQTERKGSALHIDDFVGVRFAKM